jgi:hypothetical protein
MTISTRTLCGSFPFALVLVSATALGFGCGPARETGQRPDAPEGTGGAPGGATSTTGGAPGGAASTTGGAPGGATSTAGSGGGGGGTNPLGRARCPAPVGVSASPQNTQEAVQLLNALPKPTTVACFVESLERPLYVNATSSIFSAQAALSAVSPRVFIRLGRLWLSIVIDGKSSDLIEFGDLLEGEPLRSIKGEVELPIMEPIAPSAPYDRVLYNTQGTVCGFCHYGETSTENLDFPTAFSSTSFRPQPQTIVNIDSLRAQAQICDWQLEPHRCEMLSAVFDGGSVEEVPFPASMATFF